MHNLEEACPMLLCAFCSLQFFNSFFLFICCSAQQDVCGAVLKKSDSGFCCVCIEGSAARGAAYVRYVVPTPDDEEATVEYDLDEEDEEWLQQHNHKVLQLSQTCPVHILLKGRFC